MGAGGEGQRLGAGLTARGKVIIRLEPDRGPITGGDTRLHQSGMPTVPSRVVERYFHTQCLDASPTPCPGTTPSFSVAHGQELALSVDAMVSGIHFGSWASPPDLGHKALAVNLSDMAAMGAAPAWTTVSLTMPTADEDWLQGFGDSFLALAASHDVMLLGAALHQGPLCIVVQVYGLVPEGAALRRCGARPGDGVYVTGTLGDAGAALRLLQGGEHEPVPSRTAGAAELLSRLHRPLPRVAEGEALRPVASSAIDISDGLVSDLGHILAASAVGATLELERLPLSRALREAVAIETAWHLALSAGDDYELCLTVPAEREPRLKELCTELSCPVTRIGTIDPAPGLRCLGRDGSPLAGGAGYDHFT